MNRKKLAPKFLLPKVVKAEDFLGGEKSNENIKYLSIRENGANEKVHEKCLLRMSFFSLLSPSKFKGKNEERKREKKREREKKGKKNGFWLWTQVDLIQQIINLVSQFHYNLMALNLNSPTPSLFFLLLLLFLGRHSPFLSGREKGMKEKERSEPIDDLFIWSEFLIFDSIYFMLYSFKTERFRFLSWLQCFEEN